MGYRRSALNSGSLRIVIHIYLQMRCPIGHHAWPSWPMIHACAPDVFVKVGTQHHSGYKIWTTCSVYLLSCPSMWVLEHTAGMKQATCKAIRMPGPAKAACPPDVGTGSSVERGQIAAQPPHCDIRITTTNPVSACALTFEDNSSTSSTTVMWPVLVAGSTCCCKPACMRFGAHS